MRKVIDLTHTVRENMSLYPGTVKPKLKAVSDYSNDGFKETYISLTSHTGTHMDAPAHVFNDKETLDNMEVRQFVGDALVIDCRDLKKGERITMDKINAVKQLSDKAEFLLFNTGWDKIWDKTEYYEDYPYITKEVAQYIIDTNKKGVGFDLAGIDPVYDKELTLHKQLLKTNKIVIIENLKNLDDIGNELFLFAALPLKYKNADGAPIRALAIIE